jgi:hypothetical protein
MSIHANRNLGKQLDIEFNEETRVAVTLVDDTVILGQRLGGFDGRFQIVITRRAVGYPSEALSLAQRGDAFVKVPIHMIRYVEVSGG